MRKVLGVNQRLGFLYLSFLIKLSNLSEEENISPEKEIHFFQKHPSGKYYVPREEMILDGKDE